MSEVRLGAFLRPHAPFGPHQIEAAEVAALLVELERRFPGLGPLLRDGSGQIRRTVRVFVNGEDIRNGAGGATPLHPRDRVEILSASPGG